MEDKEKKTQFMEVEIYVASNGYTLRFKDYRGNYTKRDFFTAKTLEEVKKLLESELVPPNKV